MTSPFIDFNRIPYINPSTCPILQKNVPSEDPYSSANFEIQVNHTGFPIVPKGATLIPTFPVATVLIDRLPQHRTLAQIPRVAGGYPKIPFTVVKLPVSPRTITMATNKLDIGEVLGETWGIAQQQQRAGEDRYQVKRIGSFRYFAVFDGHGGANQMGPNHVSDYAVNNLHLRIGEGFATIDLDNSNEVSSMISQVFINFDNEMYNKGKQFGSTCTVILIDDVRDRIYQINLGDSRSIIFDDNAIISATDDHEPLIPDEEARIKAAGGFVSGGRVNAQLMVSRAFGDFHLKRNNNINYDPVDGMVSAVPDIKIISFNKLNRVCNVILTSDAPYERDAFNDDALVNMTRGITHGPNLYEFIAREMVQKISPRTTDDTTIVYVRV